MEAIASRVCHRFSGIVVPVHVGAFCFCFDKVMILFFL
jgi:hypothetical protein